MANKIQLRRGLKSVLPLLDIGEPALCTDTKQIYVGDGTANIELANKAEVDSAIGQKLDLTGGEMTGNLKIPSMQKGVRCKEVYIQLTKTLSATLIEVEVSLTNIEFFGAIEIEIASANNYFDATGVIKKHIDFYINASGTALTIKDSKYTYIGKVIGGSISISDLYLKNGKPTFKILQNYNGRNSMYMNLRAFGTTISLLNSIEISDPVASTETFIPPSMAPVETVVSTGFASGWGGQVIYSKTQEGVVHVNLEFTKSTDYEGGGTKLYTLPAGIRPLAVEMNFTSILNTGGSIIVGADGQCYIDSLGGIWLVTRSVTTIANARKIHASFSYIAKN